MRAVEKMIMVFLLLMATLIFACSQKESVVSSPDKAGKGMEGTTAGNLSAGMVTTPSGLQYKDLVQGSGDSPAAAKMVTVHYTGWLADCTKFDSSVDRNEPFTFRIGAGNVIRGWDEGVMTMKIGGKRKLVIPPALGYGSAGASGVIPPNATLVFEVILLDIR